MQGNINLVFIGDSITARLKGFQDSWDKYWAPHGALNMGIGGDQTQNVVWRLRHGGLDGYKARLFVGQEAHRLREVLHADDVYPIDHGRLGGVLGRDYDAAFALGGREHRRGQRAPPDVIFGMDNRHLPAEASTPRSRPCRSLVTGSGFRLLASTGYRLPALLTGSAGASRG